MDTEYIPNKKYDILIFDSVNFAYRTFKSKGETPLQISKKSVYRDSICNFITSSEELEKKYLKSDGEIYYLFDNYFSRADLRTTFLFADRKRIDESYKATRKKSAKEFYNSVNFIRYYYLIGPSKYHTLRVDNLEADDLVEPLFNKLGVFDGKKSVLMITTDEDWTRYLLPNADWLPDLSIPPETSDDFYVRKGFKASKDNVILYKSIFGDPSDNISPVVPYNETTFNEFLDILHRITYLEELILFSRDRDECSRNSILRAISEKESAYIVNLQLISPIPCGQGVINSSLTSGRNDSTLYHTVRNAIGLDVSKEFTFGNIRRNRVS